MSNTNHTYNVLIQRFKDFTDGHYILQRFTHGQISDADISKSNVYPWLHVAPEGMAYSEGTRTFTFMVTIADLPRTKADKNLNQREIISDCLQIFGDLVATIENGVLFGTDIVLNTPINVEAFIDEKTNDLTGVEGTITLNLDYNWDACDVPASFNNFAPLSPGSTQYGQVHYDKSLNLDGASVTLDNDVEEPGNLFYYGTNESGVKGWYTLPSGSTFTCNDVDACPTIVTLVEDVSNLQTDKADVTALSEVAFSGDYNDLNNLPSLQLTAPDLDSARSAVLNNEYQVGDVVHDNGNIYRCIATNSGIAVTNPSYWVLVGPGYQTRQQASDWAATTGDNQILNKPTLFSGDYNDLTNTPVLAEVATSGDYNDLINTPDLTGYGDMLKSTYDTDNDGIVDAAKKEVVEVINKTGATLIKGTICYIKSTSSSGTHPEVLKADATTEATSSKTMGAIFEDIPNDATGLLVTSGEVRNLDTTAYNTGALLWLSTTPGQVTTTPPAEPNHVVFIGHVTRSQNVNGRVLYAIQNGYELTELHGVQCPSPSTNDVLKYDSSGLWVNGTLSKSEVGLGNVDNTSDVNKPVSTAQQTAIDLANKVTLCGGNTVLTMNSLNWFTAPGVSAWQGGNDNNQRYVFGHSAQVTTIGVINNIIAPVAITLTLRKNQVNQTPTLVIASGSAIGYYSQAVAVNYAAGDSLSIQASGNTAVIRGANFVIKNI